MSYEYADYSRLENDTRFVKIFELPMEISEKTSCKRKLSVYIINGKQKTFKK